jgi:hypothetical protein
MAQIDWIFTLAWSRNWDLVRKTITDHQLVGKIDMRDLYSGNTLLHVALCQGESPPIIKELLQYIDVNAGYPHYL